MTALPLVRILSTMMASFIVLASPSPAAIPLKTEIALQEAAPEHLHLEVLKVQKKRRGSHYTVTVTAKVLKIARTATNVKAGAEISLVYSTPAVLMPSAPPGLVDAGKRYEAFLKKDGETYDAAAASGTFKPVAAAKPGTATPSP